MTIRSKAFVGASVAAVLAAGAWGLGAASAQEGESPKPVEKPAATPAPKAPAPAEDPAALVKALGDADYDVRTRAYDRLREAGASARGALEEGAKSPDAQVRWAANRLLRQLDGGNRRGGRLEFGEEKGKDAPAAPGSTKEDEVGVRDFGFRFSFDDEAFRRSMEEMDRRMEELERRFRSFSIPDFGNGFRFEIGRPGRGFEGQAVVERDGERTDVTVGADGKVKVKLSRKGADGKAVEEAFEAESLEALKKDHPEVHAKVMDLIGGIHVRTFRAPELPRIPDVPRLGRLFQRDEEKPILGVLVSPVPPVLRTQLSIEEDEGLVVEEVTDGSLAARLGLRRHDVVLSVNGASVGEAGSLREAAGKVKEGEEIRLRVLRAGKVEEIAGKR
jgi:hypothetical protein